MTMDSLLPYNASAAERALEAAGTDAIGIPIVEGFREPWRCPAALLPWLAWSLSVDDWDPDWPVETKRQVIAQSVEVHRHKGTIGAVKTALRAMGYVDARIIEDQELPRYGTGWQFGSGWEYGPSDPHWADYWVEVLTPISRPQAEAIRDRLGNIAPVRCRLRAVRLTGVFYAYGDDMWVYGDPMSYGGIYQFGD